MRWKALVYLALGLTACLPSWADDQRNPHGENTPSCRDCHTTQGWHELLPAMSFDHGKTKFPLVGRHAQVTCRECHTSLVFAEAATQCLDCHLDDHRGQFANTCEQCHTSASWEARDKMVEHHQRTRFPLIGVHSNLACVDCHANGQFADVSTACQSCHLDTYQSVQNPDHAAAGFSVDCAQCHSITTAAWKGASFDHTPDFPLTGGHALNDCNLCHAAGFVNISSACYPCHTEDYNVTDNPDHAASNFPQNCAECHTTQAWQPASFDHNLASFPLTGAHISTSCTQCHVNGQYTGTTSECVGCHQVDFAASDNPDHEAGEYSQNCAECHTTTAWQPASFNHDLSAFPLTGAHISTSCTECHVGGQFTGTPTDCWSCHQPQFDGTVDPGHIANQMPHECAECHNTDAWSPSSFTHDATAFPLTGAHVETSCGSCHVNGQYADNPTDCWSCHQPDYASSDNPNHESLQLDHHCQQCHTTQTWAEASFNHNLSDFPLTGAHVGVSCASCHANGQYTGTPNDCWSCHQPDYASSDNPDHEAGQYSQDCAQCHTTNGWQPASFNHDLSDFPLTGAHISTSCTECHAGGQYTGTPTDCWSCHNEDYQEADEPDHTANQFPHECLSCHTTSGWEPSSFNHANTDFPLTGAHISTDCAQCHTNGNYTNLATDCWSCHEPAYNNAPDHAAAQFPHACLECHSTNAWMPSSFSHNNTGFPLTGAHIEANCASCHANGQFEGTPSACFDCHQSDFEEVDDPNHVAGNYNHACTECHTTLAWTPAAFDHNNSDFPLTGAHIAASCTQCHDNGQFNGTPTDCWSCHNADYASSDNPDHAELNLPHACAQCHTTVAWAPAEFDHNLSDFPLTGAHIGVDCASCHANGQYPGTPTDCWSCHQADYQEADEPNHVQNQFSHACLECHNTVGWEPSTFNHANTDFPLTGAHVEVNCAECHTNGNYGNLATDCWSCHQPDYQNAQDPNHVAGEYDHTCTVCHTTVAWTPAEFDHNLSDFPLTGAHIGVNCASCHDNGQFSGTPTDCWSCHQEDYQEADDHVEAQFPHECLECHTTSAWEPSSFNHINTDFPLTGAHVNVNCASCHANGQFAGTPTDCYGCHQADYEDVSDPNHVAGNFNHECLQCHTNIAWTPAVFDHNLSDFPLTGAHIDVSCTQCHIGGQFNGTPTDCWSCHEPDYQEADDPNHAANQFSHNCAQCHSTSDWEPSTFDHNNTNFPLTGGHVGVNCASCHANGQYAETPIDCWSCHQPDYEAENDPNHVADQFSHECLECHTVVAYSPASYDHNLSPFPLTGAHVNVSCVECHGSGQFDNLASDCWSCHQDNYESTDNPDHVAGNFNHDCAQCHSAAGWTPAQFDHNLSDFPLTGAHVDASCTQCHVGGQYTGTPTACFACHEPDYQGTDNPDHEAAQIDHNCASCHTTVAWTPASFDHNQTQFPLTGAHIEASCAACHVNGQFAGTSMECFACHQPDFDGAQDPNHVAGNYSHECAECHSTTGWSPASIDHSLTGFPLTGAHIGVDCAQCHVGGQFSGTPADCWSCHQPDYQEADDHVEAQFPHECLDCHTTISWQPSTFNHAQTQFPLTGAHVNASCVACHHNGQFDGTPTDCWSCHQPDYQSADDPGHVQNQLPHQCAECHTTSTWEPSTFNHAQTQFPLLGAHVSAQCIECHTGGNYLNIPTVCFECHQADYIGVQDPNHVANNYNHNCSICHTQNAWTPVNFDHNLTDFPLVGAHVGVNCASCHDNGQYSGTPMECFACHQSDYEGVSDPNHVAGDYPHTCEQCHTVNGWTPATFDHNLSGFPLTGAHISVSCTECHANGQYTGTPTDCWSCHQPDYQEADDHVEAQFPHACAQCHNTTAWEPSTFNHNNTGFPLLGAHVSVNCASCHANGQFDGTPSQCFSCHQDDFEGVSDPNHVANQFSHTCTQCHTVNSWIPASFDHNQTQFPLTGAHVSASCVQCHANGQYDNTPTDCWSCHQPDYQEADDHVEAQFPHTCAQCHNTSAWEPSTFNHNGTGFPLLGAHISVNCASCHVNGQFDGTPTQCYGCHQDDFEGVSDPNHVAGNYSHTCGQCHTVFGWTPASFNHNFSDFPLTGAHISVSCTECHGNGQYTGTPTDCWSCHQSDYEGVEDPNHIAGQFSHACNECHSTAAWEPATFNHNNTDFPLTGAHINANCTQCHVGGQFNGTPTDCWSCHQPDYQGADDHESNQFPHDCAQCHSTNAWEPSTFNHNNTNFPLTGAHISANCAECHTNGNYSNLATDCWSCHQQDYQGADNHESNQFPHTCEQCHSTSSWEPSTFNHNNTNFPLTGAHVSVNCAECHTNGNFDNLASDCWSCHEQDYLDTNDPNHQAAGFSHDCLQCHTTSNWDDADFNHGNTDFPLTGAHVSLACASCHASGQYNGLAFDCFSCHQDNFQSVTDPNHVTGGYPHDCAQCHSSAAWTPASFDHSLSNFPLMGAHVNATCTQCHANGQYDGTPTDCWSCHQPDYQQAADPSHIDNQFPHDCAQCHTNVSWEPTSFNHNNTGFPLTGAHISANCAACHTNGNYGNLATDCWSCHQSDYNEADNHVEAQFPHTCAQCHSTTSWEPSTFNHNNTGFPLLGAHTSVNCASCHANGQFDGTPTQCFACHQDDFEGVSDPNHVANQFSHTCTQCHTMNGWSPATFDHNQSNFPLTGAHINATCTQCHANGQYDGTPTDCWSCHQSDYDGATDPNHVSNQFPHACAECHNTVAWEPSTFNHNNTDFPLTGAHISVSCTECHANGQYMGTPSDCWSCHEQDYLDTDDPDHQAAGFPHECLTCHNTSNWDDADFNHSNTDFPLTGAHVNVNCASCHVGGQYQGTPTECFFCHQDDYNSAASPNHLAGGFPTDCAMCHSTNLWDGAQFSHPWFPITSGNHSQFRNECNECHLVPNNFSLFSCIDCHEHNQQDTDDDHSEVNGYSYNSQACYSCHPNGDGDGPQLRRSPR